MWENIIKKKDEYEEGETLQSNNRMRDRRSAESYKTGDTMERPANKNKISNAFRPLQKAILHLEVLGYDEMQNAIDEHFPMKSLNVDAKEVMEILKTYVSALINLQYVSSKPKESNSDD